MGRQCGNALEQGPGQLAHGGEIRNDLPRPLGQRVPYGIQLAPEHLVERAEQTRLRRQVRAVHLVGPFQVPQQAVHHLEDRALEEEEKRRGRPRSIPRVAPLVVCVCVCTDGGVETRDAWGLDGAVYCPCGTYLDLQRCGCEIKL